MSVNGAKIIETVGAKIIVKIVVLQFGERVF